MPWYPTTLSAKQFPTPHPIGTEADGRDLALVMVDGTWYAVEDRCSHAGCPFSADAVVEGDRLVCDCHGSEFDIRTGAVKRPPATRPIATFAVRIVDGQLEVEL